MLLGSSAAAFSLTTWWLVYFQSSENLLNLVSEPTSVVRRQLSALNRGDLRAAYEQFSEHYRTTVPFELFQQLVVTHRGMFRTREVQFRQSEQSSDRQVLETHIVAADGQHYVAQFTLKRGSGRWWIDDVHWGFESRRHLLYV